jgi:hypothetical protein
MTLAQLVRDPFSRSVLFADAVPLSIALEVMGQPSRRALTCPECGERFMTEDYRRFLCSDRCQVDRKARFKRARLEGADGAAIRRAVREKKRAQRRAAKMGIAGEGSK